MKALLYFLFSPNGFRILAGVGLLVLAFWTGSAVFSAKGPVAHPTKIGVGENEIQLDTSRVVGDKTCDYIEYANHFWVGPEKKVRIVTYPHHLIMESAKGTILINKESKTVEIAGNVRSVVEDIIYTHVGKGVWIPTNARVANEKIGFGLHYDETSCVDTAAETAHDL
ncbi:hypothetical protein L0Y41_01820 [bacterium]|nr:hypothetical protein [bacterium]